MFVVFFFFKQKTAYEMRISDWSSDVCSSDLTFIVGANGRPLTKESFGNEFKSACKAAGVPGSAHGVRKIAATRAADNGATEAQLMAIFGWTDPKMAAHRSEEHTSELQSLMRISYAVLCLKKKKNTKKTR